MSVSSTAPSYDAKLGAPARACRKFSWVRLSNTSSTNCSPESSSTQTGSKVEILGAPPPNVGFGEVGLRDSSLSGVGGAFAPLRTRIELE